MYLTTLLPRNFIDINTKYPKTKNIASRVYSSNSIVQFNNVHNDQYSTESTAILNKSSTVLLNL